MLSLTCAISDYDHVHDLVSGRVRSEGISLQRLNFPVEEIFFRALRFEEFDIAEMSMGRYSAMVSRGDRRFVAIPVFPSRVFRHSSIYVRSDGDIHRPADLRGKTIGVPEWAQTAGIYARGALKQQFGLELTDVKWVQAGIHQTGRSEEVPLDLPDGLSLERITDRTLDEMLRSGEIAGLISAHPPHCFEHDRVARRLFTDPKSVESQYWEETRIFPIMHALVIRRAIFESNRWIAMNLLEAFTAAKANSLQRAAEGTASRFPLPFMNSHVMSIIASFGEDYWPYGVEENRVTLTAFLQYAHEQGVTRRLLSPEDLFPAEVMAKFKI
jgi:4,5-dihydroxyphthalate decarboxylase